MEVAKRARVAVSTVSRVLNGGYASGDVKLRVEEAVRTLGYAPSVTARSLVTGRTGSVGLVAPSSQSPWFSQILAGIEEALAKSHESLLLSSLSQPEGYDASAVLDWIGRRRVDGIAFVRFTRREQALADAATAARIPLAFIAPDLAPALGTLVRCDNVRAGRLVGEYLAELGHREVLFAGGPRDSIDTLDRLEGLREELGQRNVSMPARAVWFGKDYSPEAGIEIARRFLDTPPQATAVVLGNDAMALGFMRQILLSGLHIPGDISVVGFDDIPDGALYWPALTTVHQPAHRMGAAACRALLDRIADDDDAAAQVEFDVELVVRESAASPSLGRRERCAPRSF